jgi:dTMP kinase
MRDGVFITLEGGEGAGKTTILPFIEEYLVKKDRDVVVTREPGGIEIAEKIRSIILDPSHGEMDARTEALLYAAARRQHLVEKVIPALHAGKVVLCDRFIDSSLAYQGFARGIGMEQIFKINEFAIEACMPHLTLYFDVSPEVGSARIQANENREVNRLDLEKREFHDKVREGYFYLLRQYPQRIKLVNAGQTIEAVVAETISTIRHVLSL